MAHALTACDQCGQTDDHPKLHYGVETYHHDCLPHRAHLDAVSDPKVGHIVKSIVDAAKAGVHGDDLRAHIEALHADEPAPAAAPASAPAAPVADVPAAPAAPVAPSEG
jgi:hypothetical protein